MDDYIIEKRRDFDPHMNQNIGPEDVMEVDEEDIYQFLIDTLKR